MTRRRTLPGAAVAALLVLAIAGCGEDQEFIDEYNEVAAKGLRSLGDDLGRSATEAKTPKQAEKVYGELADRYGKLVDDMQGLDPPSDAQRPFDDLVGALERGTGHLREVAKAAADNNSRKANAAVQKLSEDVRNIAAAESELKKKVED